MNIPVLYTSLELPCLFLLSQVYYYYSYSYVIFPNSVAVADNGGGSYYTVVLEWSVHKYIRFKKGF